MSGFGGAKRGRGDHENLRLEETKPRSPLESARAESRSHEPGARRKKKEEQWTVGTREGGRRCTEGARRLQGKNTKTRGNEPKKFFRISKRIQDHGLGSQESRG
jgi:hypothetical protein